MLWQHMILPAEHAEYYHRKLTTYRSKNVQLSYNVQLILHISPSAYSHLTSYIFTFVSAAAPFALPAISDDLPLASPDNSDAFPWAAPVISDAFPFASPVVTPVISLAL
jgi:hypothetical protein